MLGERENQQEPRRLLMPWDDDVREPPIPEPRGRDARARLAELLPELSAAEVDALLQLAVRLELRRVIAHERRRR
jgi:hypothetical protein